MATPQRVGLSVADWQLVVMLRVGVVFGFSTATFPAVAPGAVAFASVGNGKAPCARLIANLAKPTEAGLGGRGELGLSRLLTARRDVRPTVRTPDENTPSAPTAQHNAAPKPGPLTWIALSFRRAHKAAASVADGFPAPEAPRSDRPALSMRPTNQTLSPPALFAGPRACFVALGIALGPGQWHPTRDWKSSRISRHCPCTDIPEPTHVSHAPRLSLSRLGINFAFSVQTSI